MIEEKILSRDEESGSGLPYVLEPKVTFRIIRSCNFDCPGCCTFSSLDRQGRIRIEDFRKVVDILADNRFRGILNISGGEPTLHEKLPELIRYASSGLGSARIALFTNGDWIGEDGWEPLLEACFSSPNVLIRFSHDEQHLLGKARAKGISVNEVILEELRLERSRKAAMFRERMKELGAVPGVNFDFAFKGSMKEARSYMSDLGDVPVYIIKLRENPEKRPKEFGFLAVDVQDNGDLLVYPTLGHIPDNEPLGGVESLPEALELNRRALRAGPKTDEQHQWVRYDND